MAAHEDLAFDLGEDWQIALTCHDDPAGLVPMDLTGATVAFMMTRPGLTPIEADNGALGGVTLGDPPANGLAVIVISPGKQAGVAAGFYTYTVRVTKADGTISDQAYGEITVRGTDFPPP